MSKLQEIRDALETAAKTFRWYEELHAAKPDIEKAKRNAEFAIAMEQALATLDALMETHALVPIEPTVEMLLAAMTVWEVHNSEFDMDRLEKKYNAMIAAAQEEK